MRLKKQIANILKNNPNISNEILNAIITDYVDEEIVADISGGMNEYSDMFAEEVEQFRKAVTGDVETTNAKTPSTESKSNYSAEDYAESIDGGGETNQNGELAGTGVKYFIAKDNNGNDVSVVVDNILKGVKEKKHQVIANNIAEHIGEYYPIIESGQKVYIGDDLPSEYTQSEYTKHLNPNIKKSKNKASLNLGEMIEIASNRVWNKNKKSKHNDDAKYGWYKYSTRFAIPLEDSQGNVNNFSVYVAQLLIRNDKNGKKYLYDIIDIQKDGSSRLPASLVDKVRNIRSNHLMDNVPQKDTSVNTHSMQNSEKDTQIKLSAVSTEETQRYNEIASKYKKGDTISAEDEKVLSDIVKKAAKEKMPNTKIVDESGMPLDVYHGTYSKDFTEFDEKTIGSASGDLGFYGKGFYFATHKSEARYYGSNIIQAFLNITNPFDFETEIYMYDGKKTTSYAIDAVALLNFAEKFPELSKDIKIGVEKNYSGNIDDISISEFTKEYKKVIETKEFKLNKIKDGRGFRYYVTADPSVKQYQDANGKTHNYTDYGFELEVYDERAANDKLGIAYEYLSKNIYSYINIPSFKNIIMDSDFSNTLKRMGYDGVIQSKSGDEIVAFNSNQIKSADPITYDDNGNPIPIEKRFDESKSDIRFSASNSSKITKEDVEAIQSIKNDDGTPKSVNDFTSEDIKKTAAFAKRYFNEIGNKSPFFRAWFGDWRANDTTPINIVNKKGASRGAVKNADTGWNINVSGTVFDETKNQKSIGSKLAVPFLDYINDIVEKSILLDSCTITNKKKKSPNSAMMHSLYAFADMGNGLELLKLYVEKLNDVNNDGTIVKSYKLVNIKTSVASGRVQNNPSPVTNTTDAIYTVSDLFNIVKQYDKNFNPKPVNPILLEKDGTPKKFYHGTNAKFTAFDNNKGGLSLVSNALYFTKDKNRAEAYSEHYDNDLDKSVKGYVMEVYLKSDNPVISGEADKQVKNIPVEVREKYKDEFDIEQDAKLYGYAILDFAKFVAQNENRTQIEMLQEWGFDGTYNGVDYAVFEPTQIKSATDNIGTFDKDNPDIRFSASKKSKNNIANVQSKGYNDSEQYGTMWTLEDDVLDKREVAAFYSKISEMHNNGYKNYEMSNNGEYVFEVGNKVIYCDGNYDNPEIFEVVGFKTNDANLIAGGMEMLKFGEENGFNNTECDELAEIMLGKGNVVRTNNGNIEAIRIWEKNRGTRTNSRTPNNRSGEDVKLSATPKKSYAEQFETQDLIRMIADDIGYHEGLIEASKKNKEEFVALAKSNESLTKRLESAKAEMKRTKVPKTNNYSVLKHTKSIIDYMDSKASSREIGEKAAAIYNQYYKEMKESGGVQGCIYFLHHFVPLLLVVVGICW